MDSLLNVVYNKIRKPMNPSEKAALKNEQIKWLKTRDAYFAKVDKENRMDGNENIGTDSKMIALDDKTQFVRARVEMLIKSLQH